MKKKFVGTALSMCILLACPYAFADIKLKAEQRQNLGIETVSLQLAEIPQLWHASAQVLDPAPLITLLADSRAAQAAAASSHSELVRLEQLYKADSNVSLRALEGGRAQALADASKLAGFNAQLLATWGAALFKMEDPLRARLIEELLAGRTSLARAETTRMLPTDAELREARVRTLGSDTPWNAVVLGPAAQASSQSVGNTFILRIGVGLQPGTVLSAELSDPKHRMRGIKVPRSAIVRWQGNDWVYIEESANAFDRVLVHPTEWLDDGCLVKDELKPGQKIVAVGAMMLLAAESAHPAED